MQGLLGSGPAQRSPRRAWSGRRGRPASRSGRPPRRRRLPALPANLATSWSWVSGLSGPPALRSTVPSITVPSRSVTCTAPAASAAWPLPLRQLPGHAGGQVGHLGTADRGFLERGDAEVTVRRRGRRRSTGARTWRRTTRSGGPDRGPRGTPSAQSRGGPARRSRRRRRHERAPGHGVTNGVEGRVRELAGGVGLDADAGGLPGLAEPGQDHGPCRRGRWPARRTHRGGRRRRDSVRSHRPPRDARRGCRSARRTRGAAAWSRRRCRGRPAARRPGSRRCRGRWPSVSASRPRQPGGDERGGEDARDRGSVESTVRGSRAARPWRRGRPSRSRRPRPRARSCPVAPTCWPTAKAAGSTTAVACTRPPAWVSSKSSACTQRAVGERGRGGADLRAVVPRTVASAGPPRPSATSTAGRTVPDRIPPSALPTPSRR